MEIFPDDRFRRIVENNYGNSKLWEKLFRGPRIPIGGHQRVKPHIVGINEVKWVCLTSCFGTLLVEMLSNGQTSTDRPERDFYQR